MNTLIVVQQKRNLANRIAGAKVMARPSSTSATFLKKYRDYYHRENSNLPEII
jgi:hypothetical protein